jgi:predicted transcriptional regulator
MNQEAILAVLPDSKDDAKSLKEIAKEMGLDITAYVDWIRAERRLSSSLRALARWGLVALERRQRDDGHKFWYNAYWKTDPAK